METAARATQRDRLKNLSFSPTKRANAFDVTANVTIESPRRCGGLRSSPKRTVTTTWANEVSTK